MSVALDQVYHFEFIGGCRDGELFATDSADPNEARHAKSLRKGTFEGTKSAGGYWIAPYIIDLIIAEVPPEEIGKPAWHFYRVTDRYADGNHVWVRLTFDPNEPPKAIDS